MTDHDSFVVLGASDHIGFVVGRTLLQYDHHVIGGCSPSTSARIVQSPDTSNTTS
ncbi:hypothetical protein Rleg4DRAFT_7035 [Rhizobium leguminosarum bv. trifolii WSM2297]|uniref:Uncharacterized protein n=1 Tax=Rhizobium leguminosarum bv. trifolii WSM2297 TaxID=754762 RepID=J0WDG3_RHILT|nr:hypothetical protein Rleg4DRAFT_4987 [Rhizobium leguminosarum bv. trifolii WSM2297]EJC85164.1 hypothetical protein Rleg4DRAFT_7035 [Rhizobium leguminosarum bv. trifolii WSM2297]